jgi:predicted N-acetyltransferase YhbS
VAHIRRAVATDADAVLRCLGEAFAPFQSDYTSAAFNDTVLSAATIAQRMAEMTVMIAIADDGAVVGTVGFSQMLDGQGHIRGMAVRPRWHGRGVAQQLLATAERDLRALGCSRICLETTAPLLRASRFYERNGYAPSGKITDFFGMPLIEYLKTLARA